MRQRIHWLAMFQAAALTVLASSSTAGVTSPANSYVDPCILACPAGDIVFHTVMRDANNNPQDPGYPTHLDLCPCGEVVLWPPEPGDPYTIEAGCRPVTPTTLPLGASDFPLRAGGRCAGAEIRIFSGGVLVATRTSFASPDQDGSLVVDGQDWDLVAAKIAAGAFDPTADLDCSGRLDAGDLAVLERHLGHASGGPVATTSSSWGRIKALYR